MMRKLFCSVGCVLALLSSHSAFCEVEPHNGNLWRSLSREMQISYVQGIIDGLGLGAHFVMVGIPKSDPARLKVAPAAHKTIERLLTNVAPSQIADGVDSIFKDYRNRSLLMTDAIYISLESIAGMPPENVEALLRQAWQFPK